MAIPEGLNYLFDKKLVGIISTQHHAGYPHSVPVWIARVDGKLYFSTYKSSKKTKNLIRNPKCGLTIVDTSGGPYVHVLTSATIRTKEGFSRTREIVDIIMRKYVPLEKVEQFTQDRMDNPERILVELDVVKVLKNPFTSNNPDKK